MANDGCFVPHTRRFLSTARPVFRWQELSKVGAAMGSLTVVGHVADVLVNATGMALLLHARSKVGTRLMTDLAHLRVNEQFASATPSLTRSLLQHRGPSNPPCIPLVQLFTSVEGRRPAEPSAVDRDGTRRNCPQRCNGRRRLLYPMCGLPPAREYLAGREPPPVSRTHCPEGVVVTSEPSRALMYVLGMAVLRRISVDSVARCRDEQHSLVTHEPPVSVFATRCAALDSRRRNGFRVL